MVEYTILTNMGWQLYMVWKIFPNQWILIFSQVESIFHSKVEKEKKFNPVLQLLKQEKTN